MFVHHVVHIIGFLFYIVMSGMHFLFLFLKSLLRERPIDEEQEIAEILFRLKFIIFRGCLFSVYCLYIAYLSCIRSLGMIFIKIGF